MARPIVFLSDYGTDDEFVGTCHGVIARIAPEARVIDLTHAIAPRDVMRGALTLAGSLSFMPEGAVFLAVVDPGVGTSRRSIAVETVGGCCLVGPDNGLLSPALARLDGVVRAVKIESSEVVMNPVSPTFHGRDVFAPAAAHLSAGVPIGRLGPAIDPGTIVAVDEPAARTEPGRLCARVIGVDRFGNLQLGAGPEDLAAAGLDASPALDLAATNAGATVLRARTFADVAEGDMALLVDSAGRLALAMNGGDASDALGLVAGDAVTLAERGSLP